MKEYPQRYFSHSTTRLNANSRRLIITSPPPPLQTLQETFERLLPLCMNLTDSKPLITVFTPTYNRANTIGRLFDSLCRQTADDFEWLVVDDGSTDNTPALIADFQKKASFSIVYRRKDNGGKHTAYNEALGLARGDIFFTVDSDDWLPEDSIEKIAGYAPQLLQKAENAPGGIIALKCMPDHKVIGCRYPEGHEPCSAYRLECEGLGGERSIVLLTSIARQYPFDIIPGERFIGECTVFDRIGEKYPLIISNDILTICEYQPDGLSSNPRKIMVNNPGGYKLYFRQRIDMARSFRERVRYILRYHAFRKLFKGCLPSADYHGKHIVLVTLLSPLGGIAARHYKKSTNE